MDLRGVAYRKEEANAFVFFLKFTPGYVQKSLDFGQMFAISKKKSKILFGKEIRGLALPGVRNLWKIQRLANGF